MIEGGTPEQASQSGPGKARSLSQINFGLAWQFLCTLTVGDILKLAGVSGSALFAAAAFGAQLGPFTAIFPAHKADSPAAVQKMKYYGYYWDVKPDRSQKMNEETFDLEFLPGNEVQASVQGVVSADKQRTELRTWKFKGFRTSSHIAMSYATVSDHGPLGSAGIGSYVLDVSNGKDYPGTAIYWDCINRAMFQCPYVMTLEKIDPDYARQKWPKLFANRCTQLDLAPDEPILTASNAPLCGAAQQNRSN